MSEKIYAWLLRLYPSHFRQTYGEEALQLFRDRARDERGFFPKLRLWADLLADLAMSVPREYSYVRPGLLEAAVQQRVNGAPSFFVLGEETPPLGALISGCVLTMVAVSVVSILISRGGN